MSEIFYERAVSLIEADLGNELLGLDVHEGSCFGFNEVATTVWRWLEKPRSMDELKHLLLGEYDIGSEQCAQELEEFIRELVGKGLIKAGSSPDQARAAD